MSQERMDNSQTNTNRSQPAYQAPNIESALSRATQSLKKNRIVHGANEAYHELEGKTVGYVRKSLRDVLNLPGDAQALIAGKSVSDDFVLEGGVALEFCKEAGVKGFSETTYVNIKDLKKVLEENKDAALQIKLPSGDFVPEHFHVTEVGNVEKVFIDCGGFARQDNWCSLQAWTAHDVEHRLNAGKLFKILGLAEKILKSDELPVEVEYGADVASNYQLVNVEVAEDALIFVLAGRKTDCLAPDKCGITPCCSGGGCC